MGLTVFNDPSIKFNILSGDVNSFKFTDKIADGLADGVITKGKWVMLDATGNLTAPTGTVGQIGCRICLQNATDGDVRAFNIQSDGTTFGGYCSTVFGVYIGEVGTVGYDHAEGAAAFAPQTPLKVNADGILTPVEAGTDIVSAYSLGINDRNMLVFSTHGAK